MCNKHKNTDTIICPNCGKPYFYSKEKIRDTIENCMKCGKDFYVERVIKVSYSTTVYDDIPKDIKKHYEIFGQLP